jgi:hypothetical protein
MARSRDLIRLLNKPGGGLRPYLGKEILDALAGAVPVPRRTGWMHRPGA